MFNKYLRILYFERHEVKYVQNEKVGFTIENILNTAEIGSFNHLPGCILGILGNYPHRLFLKNWEIGKLLLFPLLGLGLRWG